MIERVHRDFYVNVFCLGAPKAPKKNMLKTHVNPLSNHIHPQKSKLGDLFSFPSPLSPLFDNII